MPKKQNKRKSLNRKYGLLVISGLIIGLVVILGAYLTMTGFAVQSENVLEKTIEIEVWANTYVEIKSQEKGILATLLLDNGTELAEQEIEFYLEELFLSKETTDSQGHTLSTFNLSDISSGKYSLKLLSQSTPTQYLNSLETEFEIEIIEENGIKSIVVLSEEESKPIEIEEILEELNETVEIFENLECQEFTENVL